MRCLGFRRLLRLDPRDHRADDVHRPLQPHLVVLGGLGSMSGTIIAAILLALLSTVLQEVSDIRMILYSLMLVLIMIFRPGGLMGSKELSQTVLGRVFTRKGAQP